MKRAWMYLLVALVFISCGGKKSVLKSYYFPYADFTIAKVYKYVNAKDTADIMYWRFETVAQNGDTVMSTAIYNKDLTLTSVFHNKITEEGAQLQSMLVNTGDSILLVNCEIKKNESFNWQYSMQAPWLVAFAFKNPDGISSQEVVSERNVEKQKQKITVANQLYDCIVIKESTMFNVISSNRTRSEEQQRTSYFAQGIGLIKFETFHANGTSDIFELKEIIIDKDKKTVTPVKQDSLSSIQ